MEWQALVSGIEKKRDLDAVRVVVGNFEYNTERVWATKLSGVQCIRQKEQQMQSPQNGSIFACVSEAEWVRKGADVDDVRKVIWGQIV